KGFRGRGRHLADRRRARPRNLHRRSDPVYTCAYEPGRGAPGRAGEPRGRYPRQIRRAAAPRALRPAGGGRSNPMKSSPYSDIPAAIEDIRQGRMVVVADDEDRENEGDLTIAAEKVTPEVINFMARHGRGLICLPMTGDRLDELRISLMVQDEENSARFWTAFCVPIEAKQGTTTGISAADRARTILAAIDPRTKPEDLARPGHMFPLRAMDGGVLVRAGQTEAAVDLARLAGLYPAGVICEVMAEDGTMAR